MRKIILVNVVLVVNLIFNIVLSQNHHIADKASAWSIKVTDTSNYTPAYLGNGIIGIRTDKSGLMPKSVHINGLYDKTFTGDAHLIDEYNPLLIKLVFNNGAELAFGDKVTNWSQTLQLKEGILYTTYDYDNKLNVKTQLLSLRNLPVGALGIFEFEAKENIEFTVQNIVTIPGHNNSSAIYKPLFNFESYKLSAQSKERISILSSGFLTASAKDFVAGANTFYFDGTIPELTYKKGNDQIQQVSFKVSLKKGEIFSFAMLSSFQHTGFSSDPYNDAIRICGKDYNLGYKYLLQQHKKKWAELWKSDIEIEGDDAVQIDTRLALYSLYSSGTKGFDLSIPPCGISNEWGGHIFWDAEIWMFPVMLAMQPDIATSMINFRFNTLMQAKKRASEFGFEGAMYPWESDLMGNECTSIKYKIDMTEHHITADIALAAWSYYSTTKDKLWLRQKGFPMLKEIADFWVSRVTKDARGKYHINNVVGVDEYFEDIDDDAFTNAAVKIALKNAGKASVLVNEKANPEWEKVADGIVVLQHKNGYTLQNNKYDGRIIKQADVNLLAFPLEYIKDSVIIIKDLLYYEPKINIHGPSMSYSVLATSYARLGQTKKAYELFLKAFQPNRKPPFNFIAERSTNNVSVFCTGYGGMLQTILYGFAGMRIGSNGFYAGKSNLPSHWKKLTIKRIGQKDIVCVKS